MAIKHFLRLHEGFLYMFKGLRILLSDFRLIRVAMAPFIVNSLLFTIFFFSFNYFAYSISEKVFQSTGQEWYWAALSTMLGVVLFAVSILVIIFGFTLVGLIIASPFNDRLTAALEKKLRGEAYETSLGIWGQALFTLKNESKRMSLVAIIQISLFVLNILPGFGQLAFMTLSFVFVSFVMAYEFTGYTLDRRGFSFSQKKDYVMSNLGLTLGFGMAVALTMVVPLVNFLLMPVAVAGGTLLTLDNPPDKK